MVSEKKLRYRLKNLHWEVLDFNKSIEHILKIFAVIPDIDVTLLILSFAMKNGKAPGLGNIKTDLLKAGPRLLMELLALLLNKCLKGETIPDEWRSAVISSIFVQTVGA